ncbi:F0F1 ATP synthase subunit B [Methylicorpusculum sp.]|uniref:F0F1 ATP synthase subunit B family protein n=1 Tax=Methylicorpusculum sp. TaxID=2713644 RepID=UPI00271B1BF3|nr:F0F1 ATP synthase subunit B [Methylicorpusculum sp.]MDO8842911.1 F0F1 ATP synthase subunit B [Methylicorpusculum sp.]
MLMDFNVSTFFLEIINFLILLWVLQRLFYKPLLEVIAKRKSFIDQTVADANTTKQQAEALRDQYQNRQQQWEQEKQAALVSLNQQIEAERSLQLNKLRSDLEDEKQKLQVSVSRQQEEFKKLAEKQALKNGARFAVLLLQQTASDELEAKLTSLLIDKLSSLPNDCTSSLHLLKTQKTIPIKISSAYLMPVELRKQLELKLKALIDGTITFHYFQAEELIAGVRIDIDSWELNANLQHELSAFAELADEIV